MDEDKWDKRYLEMAELVAGWSKDRAKVGAVIVRNNRVIATGFNGFPTNVLDKNTRLKNTTEKLDMVVHAEINALIVAGINAEGATLYVHGKPVCSRCAASVIQSGIRRVVAMHPDGVSKKSKWHKTGARAAIMFLETQIQFHAKTLREYRKKTKPVAKRTNGIRGAQDVQKLGPGQNTNGDRHPMPATSG
jgi:dCMP deaminase